MGIVFALARKPPPTAMTNSRAAVTPEPAQQPAPSSLQPPRTGLRALEDYHDLDGSRRTALESEDVWIAAQLDFARALAQPGVTDAQRAVWTAGERFATARGEWVRGQLDQAAAHAREAVRAQPDDARMHALLGQTLARRKEFADAMESARKAHALDPAWVLPEVLQAALHADMNEPEQAIVTLNRVHARAPKSASALGALVLALHASRMDTEATRLASEALALDPELVAVRLMLAERALEQGQYDEALTQSTRGALTDPTSVSAQLARGDALVGLGKVAEARGVYARALALADRSKENDAPEDRMTALREAWARGEVPAPRAAELANANLPNRTRPTAPGAHDRSRPQPPARTRVPATTRTQPSGGNVRHDRTSNDPLSGLDGL
jgi:tetratricopeptide (TPR) repeat protein